MNPRARSYRSLWLLATSIVLLSPATILAQDGFWDWIHELSGPRVVLEGIEIPIFPQPTLFSFAPGERDFYKTEVTKDTYRPFVTLTYAASATKQDTNEPVEPREQFRAHLFEAAVRYERFSPTRTWTKKLLIPEFARIGYSRFWFRDKSGVFDDFSNDAISLTPMWNFCPRCILGIDFMVGVRARYFFDEFTPQDFGESLEAARNGGEWAFSWLLLQGRFRFGLPF